MKTLKSSSPAPAPEPLFVVRCDNGRAYLRGIRWTKDGRVRLDPALELAEGVDVVSVQSADPLGAVSINPEALLW